jgi:hypothetical protein
MSQIFGNRRCSRLLKNIKRINRKIKELANLDILDMRILQITVT